MANYNFFPWFSDPQSRIQMAEGSNGAASRRSFWYGRNRTINDATPPTESTQIEREQPADFSLIRPWTWTLSE